MEPSSSARGIRRKVDDLGRVVIPASMRRILGIQFGDEVEITIEGTSVVLAKPVEQCVFCGGEDHLEPFARRLVCWSCSAALRALDRERAPDAF